MFSQYTFNSTIFLLVHDKTIKKQWKTLLVCLFIHEKASSRGDIQVAKMTHTMKVSQIFYLDTARLIQQWFELMAGHDSKGDNYS